MQNVAVRKMKDLDENARQWVQRVFGHEFHEEDQITLLVFPPHPAPPANVRQEGTARLEKLMDQAAAKAKDVPDEELEAAVDEAMEQIRRREP
ncbi:MAG: hypothetical protein L0Y72_23860 [Gemmataceae bacterium]|nr:hypothetical protein [Gemmataceae bacterium]